MFRANTTTPARMIAQEIHAEDLVQIHHIGLAIFPKIASGSKTENREKKTLLTRL
ncbi:hypothetical protein D3C83_292150 [compost metagenome]